MLARTRGSTTAGRRTGCGRCGGGIGGRCGRPALFELVQTEIDVAHELVELLLDEIGLIERLLDAARQFAHLPFEGGNAHLGLLDEAV